jgi:hypothetical protein
MSELSMDELLAETGEVLPKRETLGIVAIYNAGGASATNYSGSHNVNTAVNVQPVVVTNDSFNSVHNHFLTFI